MKYCLIFDKLCVNLNKVNEHQIPISNTQIITNNSMTEFQGFGHFDIGQLEFIWDLEFGSRDLQGEGPIV